MTKPTVEEINNFHELLKGFIDSNSSLENAIDTLKAIQEPAYLSALLEEYYQGEAIFRPLTEEFELRNLLIYFCEINPNIIKMPFKSGPSASRFCILQMVLQDKAEYIELYHWIESNQPALLEAGKEYEDQVSNHQKTLIAFVNEKNLMEFQTLLKGLSQETLIDVLYQDNDILFIDTVLNHADLSYLTYLISLNISTLRIDMYGETILDCLCDQPMRYRSILELVRETYQGALSSKEQQQVSKALLAQQDSNLMDDWVDLPYDALTEAPISLPAPFNKLSPEEQFDEDIKPFINTRLLVDNSILDAFLFQSYKDKLAGRRIALMPTIRSSEAISPEQLEAIRGGTPHMYTTGVTLEGGDINPVTGDHLTAPNMGFAVWPVCVSNAHYGVFILDIRPNRGPQAIRGFYIEPLNCEWMIQLMCANYAVQLPEPHDPVLLRQMLSSFMYEDKVKQLTMNLDVRAENIEYVFLSQDPKTNLCSDNVIAVLDCLASDGIDLLNNPTTINILQNQYLSEAMARTIRLQQVKQFGMDYLWLQLPKELQNDTTKRRIDALKQAQQGFLMGEAASADAIAAASAAAIDSAMDASSIEQNLPLLASWCSMFPEVEATMDLGLPSLAAEDAGLPIREFSPHS